MFRFKESLKAKLWGIIFYSNAVTIVPHHFLHFTIRLQIDSSCHATNAMHILIVDDLKTDRFIIKRNLQNDFDVTTLSSAKEALAFSKSHSFDIALINAMLQHDLDGIDLLRNLTRIRPEGFKAYATTCFVTDSRRERLMAAGFNGILLKPFNKEQLISLFLSC
jgi:CheY-like chemotaxis protein